MNNRDNKKHYISTSPIQHSSSSSNNNTTAANNNKNSSEMIKTSFHNHLPNVHGYDISQSSMIPSLSHFYNTSSVPSSTTCTSSPYPQQGLLNRTNQTNHLNQARYHPYQRSNCTISPPPTPHHQHYHRFSSSPQQQQQIGGEQCIDTTSLHASSTTHLHNNTYHQHLNQQQHVMNRSSPTSSLKKSPISSEDSQIVMNSLDSIQSTPVASSYHGGAPPLSSSRKKIPNRSSYETHVFMNTPGFATSPTPNHPPQKRKNVISKLEMIRVLHLPQTQASSILGCSLSTLKRRFYELKEELEMEKWPQFYHEIRHLPIFSKVYPMSFYFILNHDGCDDMRKPLTKQHLENTHSLFEQNCDENTNHFLHYCKSNSR